MGRIAKAREGEAGMVGGTRAYRAISVEELRSLVFTVGARGSHWVLTAVG